MDLHTTPEITPTPPRRRSAIVRAFLALVAAIGLVAGASALPASAASPQTYFGLGDSIAAGTGGGAPLNACVQTAVAYPTQLNGTNFGCFGALTTDVTSFQVPAVRHNARTVTITVGANDVGVGAVVAACMNPATPVQCQEQLSISTTTLIPALPAKLASTIAAAHAQAPNARITLTGYPLLFTVSGLPTELQPVATEINAATVLLNATIATTALKNGALYTDVTWRFLGHGYGSTSPWINGPIETPTGLDPASFHPNYLGYTYGYVPAVRPFVS
ncbi:hypothetical protein GCM10012320_22540 [Sinomonas cellulolyticus]|uniref:SGNH hydrolase-type esterase domain-containing protein n=1 Tax=Sinomonas cellulolyticus TaxID=2801916 RepID=A0ABS1K4C9_9MICC|nr:MULTISPECIES: GDSL-type esterase/lipase family protein [Sinomonas]MBL0705762.1 hypothetical protein [Sinomonas cellulolyticus]GHG52303.1 hypothetical protein GCM10012320_22540 [Sinomonas sp. KCTC 49339]